ncbi:MULTISPECIES: GntR family transcriptional regulator [Klebsiella]|uniref:GntR family transcriptional regulator n=1 Tax=Klebsiella TaxID=570 RepID=UPI0009B52A1F|nr:MULTISPECIES: GntR family transcriptional regulator [Klebsiella]EKZ9877706.1 GntR family transcriptional regulator [Klebsiella pneumoniae]ELA0424955.1 GntR family transcriptional regulator [Klebsiella pneumoniae]MDE1098484.1 GntR family transcriptional regulator [Klebsiella pneumoniae]MEE2284061.1 GntR family transcriptional regulator [Klebsiella pneumoniae]ROF87205.1 GntR family transcriptional regulator [Klebsiella pneumoniae subsp. pneumoniae]
MPNAFKTLEQRVLNLLRNDILSGKYRPGDRLRQDEVAKRFDISTTPVREAFRGLRSEGLISIDANKGVVVKGLSIDDVTEIYELRIMLEPLLAKKSVSSITPESLLLAEQIHDEMCKATDPHNWSSLNRDFHVQLMSSESHTRLYEMVKNLLVVAEPYVSLSIFVHPEILQTDNDDHFNILEAYRRGDAMQVEEIVRKHLTHTLETIQASVNEDRLSRLISPKL